jgi:hypothetical protein
MVPEKSLSGQSCAAGTVHGNRATGGYTVSRFGTFHPGRGQ